MNEAWEVQMKNEWTTYYTGYVVVKAHGNGTERLINQLIRQGIHVWNVRKIEVDTLEFYLRLSDVKRLRRVIRKSDCKVTFKLGKGAPFLWKRVWKNSGFLIGLFAFLICIFVLSNMVWGIEIHNAKPATEHAIRKELDAMGVQKGKFQFFIDDVDQIQRKLSDRIEALTWVGVELKGTTFHLQVVEKKQPKEIKATSPQHLVATKKAIIKEMFVEKGVSKVKINDYVQKGDLLVSGVIGTEKAPEIVPAKGIIRGETWYRVGVEIPLETNFSVFNGEEKTRYGLKFWDMNIPIWGFIKPTYPEMEEEVTNRPLRFLQWELPISYVEQTWRSKEDVTRKYTRQEAVKEAEKMARKDLEKKLGDEAEIIGENILRETVDNGKVNLSIHYQVIEEIAAGQPIIQGD